MYNDTQNNDNLPLQTIPEYRHTVPNCSFGRKKSFLTWWLYVLRISDILSNRVDCSRQLVLHRKDYFVCDRFFAKADLISAKCSNNCILWTSWSTGFRTRVPEKFKRHSANTLFEAIIYRQPINFLKFSQVYVRPVFQIQTEL